MQKRRDRCRRHHCLGLGGVSLGLKAKRGDIQIALADPPGAALYSYYTTGALKAEGSSITEGIGQGRITKNLEGAPIDDALELLSAYGFIEITAILMAGAAGLGLARAILVPGRMTRSR